MPFALCPEVARRRSMPVCFFLPLLLNSFLYLMFLQFHLSPHSPSFQIPTLPVFLRPRLSFSPSCIGGVCTLAPVPVVSVSAPPFPAHPAWTSPSLSPTVSHVLLCSSLIGSREVRSPLLPITFYPYLSIFSFISCLSVSFSVVPLAERHRSGRPPIPSSPFPF